MGDIFGMNLEMVFRFTFFFSFNKPRKKKTGIDILINIC